MMEMDCPKCFHVHDMGEYPDHWREGGDFDFECEACSAELTVLVEFDPVFYPAVKS